MRSVPRLCEFNPGICLTTKEKHGKTSVRVENLSDFQLGGGAKIIVLPGPVSTLGGPLSEYCDFPPEYYSTNT